MRDSDRGAVAVPAPGPQESALPSLVLEEVQARSWREFSLSSASKSSTPQAVARATGP